MASSLRLDLLGQTLERGLIVAEDLDFDGRRRALEVAEHVLQQLHELDLGVGHGLAKLVAQAVDDLVPPTSFRSLRGFRRTRMSPLFCCVANRPISDPVRRTNVAISGVSLRMCSILRRRWSVSSSAMPAGAR